MTTDTDQALLDELRTYSTNALADALHVERCPREVSEIIELLTPEDVRELIDELREIDDFVLAYGTAS